MKQRILLIILSLTLLIIASSCATTDEAEIQANYLEDKILENPHIIQLYMYLIDYYWNEKSDLKNALRIANSCVENNANNPKAHILAAQTLYNTGFIKEAESFLKRRISERRNFDAILLLAKKLREYQRFVEAKQLLINGFSDIDTELSEDAKTFIELQQLELAKIEYAQKNHLESKKYLLNLINNSSNPEIVNSSGCLMVKILVKEDDFKNVEDFVNELIEKGSVSAELVELITYSYMYFDEYHELANILVKIYKKVQDLQLKQTIMFQLVLDEILRGRTEDALKYVKLGLELKPVFAPFLIFDYYLNYYKFDDKDAEELEARREKLISYDIQYFKGPETFESFQKILRGNSLRYLGLIDKSEKMYTEVLEIEPDLTWLMLAMAELSIDKKNYTDAVFWYSKVTSLKIKNSELFCQIGDCMLKLGEYDKAKEAFGSALKEFDESVRAMKGIEITKVMSGLYKYEGNFTSIFVEEQD